MEVHEYQVYAIEESYTIVSAAEITEIDFGKVFKGLDPAHPVAFTTELNPNSDCPN